jgi:transposase
VLDKLVAHRTEKVKDLIEERGAELVFLPSYSPDLMSTAVRAYLSP